jgi:glycosyltransferase involved in cell wall biosynthesis
MIGDYLLDRAARSARRKGNAARDERRWTDAVAQYRRYLSRQPQDAAIWVQLGHMLGESGQFDEAERAYQTADKLQPGNADLALCRGHLAVRQGKVEEARLHYTDSLLLDGNTDARNALANLEPSPAEQAEDETTDAAPDAPGGTGFGPVPPQDEPQAAEETPAPPAAEEQQPEEISTRVGRFDGWFQRSVSGFVLAEPGERPLVEFRVDGQVIGRTRARLPRDNASEHGFRAMLDVDGDTAIVSAYRLPGGEELDNSPVQLHPNPAFGHGAPRAAWMANSTIAKPFAMPATGEVALFVTHAPMGKLKPHVPGYLRALKDQGVATLLVAVADRPLDLPSSVLDLLAGAMVRENVGYDFAAWAHALKLYPELFGAKLLLLLNDSVMGPVDGPRFARMMERVRASEADLVGLTESHEYGWHLQSYFVACKPRLLSSWAFHGFWDRVQMLGSKDDVVRTYEIPFARAMESYGHTVEVLFPSHLAINPSLFGWRELLADGFPFVKLLLLRGLFPEADTDGWRDTLVEAGFDIGLIDQTIGAANEYGPEGPNHGLLTRHIAHAPDAPKQRLKIAFYGPWNYDNGLGSASRNLLAALRRTGARVNAHPIKKPFHVHRPLTPPVDILDFEGTPDIAIVHLNPDSWHLLTDEQLHAVRSAHRRIGYWVWEMGHLPPAWRAEFHSVDRIWSPSRYCADVFARESDAPVDVIPHPVPVAPARAVDRKALFRDLGLRADGRIILYVFDGSSYLVRKNPAALVRAFAASGLGEQGWTLVLKTKHLMDRPEDGAAFKALAEGTPSVHLIDRSLDPATLADLVAAADIYASPHCSEGFGLTIAEAMAAGKPVVATDFSGSRDFLDASCGYPVRAHRWELSEDFGHYTAGGEWARIDEPALANALAKAAASVDTGDTRIGDAARQRIAGMLSLEAVAHQIVESLDATVHRGGPARPAGGFGSNIDAGVPFDDVDWSEGLVAVPLAEDGSLDPERLADLPTEADRWIAFAPEQALASPQFERSVLDFAAGRPDAAILYADDVAVGEAQGIDQIRLKPEFDVTLLAAQDYVGWPVIVRASALAQLGLRAEHGAAVLTDLLLRAHAAGLSIVRIPEVLLAFNGPRPRVPAGKRRTVLQELPAFALHDVAEGRAPGLLALERRFDPGTMPPVTLLIPTRRSPTPDGQSTYIERLLGGIAETNWPMERLKVIVGDDIEDEAPWAERNWPFELTRLATPRAPDEPFNYAAKMNRLWRAAETEQLVFLNDDLLPLGTGWLKGLQTFALDEGVGGVGARLLYEDGRLQHAGIAPLFAAVAHVWLGARADQGGYQDWALAQREWSMVTGAVFATRRSLMEKVNGFDEGFSLEFNDVDLCLNLRAMGYRIVYTPDAEFTHAEKASRGETLPPGEEMARFTTRWRRWLEADPAFHPRHHRERFDLAPQDDPHAWYR